MKFMNSQKTDIVFRIRVSKLSQISRFNFQVTRREFVVLYIISLFASTELFVAVLQCGHGKTHQLKRLTKWKCNGRSNKRIDRRRINSVVLSAFMYFGPISYVEAMSH